MLLEGSEEGDCEGLGWLQGVAVKLKYDDKHFKVPHMGWSFISPKKPDPILHNLNNSKFYFVHSYYVEAANANLLTTSNYQHPFASGLKKEKIYGFQFHPEKSHKYGMKLLSNFCSLV